MEDIVFNYIFCLASGIVIFFICRVNATVNAKTDNDEIMLDDAFVNMKFIRERHSFDNNRLSVLDAISREKYAVERRLLRIQRFKRALLLLFLTFAYIGEMYVST